LESGQLSASGTAIKEISILTGHRVERSEVGAAGEFDALTDDELERMLVERIARLGFTDVLTLHIPHMDNAADVDNAG
jgi:hypothetical protein